MIQVLKLFGYLPNMLELSVNPCHQGCSYCYAKTWKSIENIPIEKTINSILRLENKKEGLLPFLIRNRNPITISNRTDIMCSKYWREYLYALKQLGFPLYIETKLNKDYKDLKDILDDKDTVYQTITGYNNKYEENNILSAEEKIEAAKWLNENGVYHTLAVNPFMPDKVSVDEIKSMIDYIKPYGFVMRDYHKTSRSIDKKYFMDEYDKNLCLEARTEIRNYCIDKKVLFDIDFNKDYIQQYPSLSLRIASNNRCFDGNNFVSEKIHSIYEIFTRDKNLDVVEYWFEDYIEDCKKQIEYFKDCIFTKNCYNITNGKSNFKWNRDKFDIYYFLLGLWNNKKITDLDYYTDFLDTQGNLVFSKFKKDLME